MDIINYYIDFKNKWQIIVLDLVILSFWGFILLSIGYFIGVTYPSLVIVIDSPEPRIP
jgi:hypothetical protein